MKVFSPAKLKSVELPGNAEAFKQKLVALLSSTSTRRHLPSPLEEVINGAIAIWAVTRFSTGLPCPRGSAPSSDRALTIREAALVDNHNKRQPIFIKTVITLPTPVGPQFPHNCPVESGFGPKRAIQDSQMSQPSNLSANSPDHSSYPP